MKTKDQQLLEEAYRKIYESDVSKTEPGWLDIPKSEHNKPCICGSGHPFNGCCGIGAKNGDLVYVMDEDECHWLNFSGIKEPYKTYWNDCKNKCGILIGRKLIPFSTFSKSLYAYAREDDSKELIYGIKRPNGKIYEVPHSVVDSEPSEDALKQYKKDLALSSLEDKLPEIKGIF
jgi:hypothetical protein